MAAQRRTALGRRPAWALWGAAVLAAAGAVVFVLVADGSSSSGGAASAVDPVQVARGRAVAEGCTVCHAVQRTGQYRAGPGLWNVVGAPKARVEGFGYSRALREAGGRWTVAELDAFLADPHGYLPGTAMTFDGLPDDQARADLIAYLSTLHD